MPKIVICPDSFKGSLSAVEAAEAIECGVRRACGNRHVDTVKLPLADGGEGTVHALVSATSGSVRRVRVHDPLMREIDAFFGILGGSSTAVVEMAAASGLCLLDAEERNPLVTTTYGTGELLMAAAETGVDRIIVGIGGSATNDGGAGAMTALGAVFMDGNEVPLAHGGAALQDLAGIDMTGFRFPVGRIEVEVACDVTNPLVGPNGASAVFGPQKGATPQMVKVLDRALSRYAEVIGGNLHKDISEMPGAGAAGGLGAGLAAFLDARLRSGIDIVLDAVGFDDAIRDADLIVTGEGRIDEQTMQGKTIGGVLKRAAKWGVPVAAVAGSVSGDIADLRASGLSLIESLTCEGISEEDAQERASELVEQAAARAAGRALTGSD